MNMSTKSIHIYFVNNKTFKHRFASTLIVIHQLLFVHEFQAMRRSAKQPSFSYPYTNEFGALSWQIRHENLKSCFSSRDDQDRENDEWY